MTQLADITVQYVIICNSRQ